MSIILKTIKSMEILSNFKPYVYVRGFVQRIDLKDSVSNLVVLICETRMGEKLELEKQPVVIAVETKALQENNVAVGTEILIELDLKEIKDGNPRFTYRNFYYVNKMPEEKDFFTHLKDVMEASTLHHTGVTYREPEKPEEKDSLIERINERLKSFKPDDSPLVIPKRPQESDHPVYNDGSSIY